MNPKSNHKDSRPPPAGRVAERSATAKNSEIPVVTADRKAKSFQKCVVTADNSGKNFQNRVVTGDRTVK